MGGYTTAPLMCESVRFMRSCVTGTCIWGDQGHVRCVRRAVRVPDGRYELMRLVSPLIHFSRPVLVSYRICAQALQRRPCVRDVRGMPSYVRVLCTVSVSRVSAKRVRSAAVDRRTVWSHI